jgi:hypothetical protein
MHLDLFSLITQTQQNFNNTAPNQGINLDEIYTFIVIAILVTAYFFIRRFTNSHRGSKIETAISGTSNIPVDDNSSLILTMYTLGVSLTEVSSGTFQNYNYTVSVTSPINMAGNLDKIDDPVNESLDDQFNAQPTDLNIDVNKYDNWQMSGMRGIRYTGPKINAEAPVDLGQIRTPANQIIIKVSLPLKSQVHVAGFSLQDTVFKTMLGNTNINYTMTKVNLEGNFPDYFKIYSQKDKEVEVREVLDPGTMEFLVDFCEQLNWELFENTLYFVQSGTTRKISDNNAGVLKAAEEFVTKILPTLNRMQNIPNTSTQSANIPTGTPPVSNQPTSPPITSV